MFDWKLISSDSHIVEPPDLWAGRLDRSFRARGPRVVTEPDGDWWTIDGTRGNSFQGGAQVGKRFEHAAELRPAARFSEVRPGAYQPEEFLRENEHDGIWASVIYPTAGLQLFRVPDLDLLSACFRAYNDWLADFCRTAPQGLRGIALINIEDVAEAIRELGRARRMGLAGAMITVAPPEERSYDHAMYEPFWAAAQDLAMPISLHIDTNRPAPYVVAESNRTSRAALLAFSDELLAEWDWTEHFAAQPETERYLNHVADKFHLRRDIQFRSRVRAAVFDEVRVAWEITLEDGRRYRSRYLVTAVGPLSAPTLPRIAGIDDFEEAYHTARWPKHAVSFAGKRVAVIGAGATGVQAIQEIAKTAGHLTVFQRRPNWCTPLYNRPITKAEMDEIRKDYPALFQRCRETAACFLHTTDPRGTFEVTPEERLAFWEALYASPGFAIWLGNFRDMLVDREANNLFSDFVADKIRQRVKDPKVAEMLIPKDHGFGTAACHKKPATTRSTTSRTSSW